MEEYLRIVQQGNFGEESALKDLGLEGNQEVCFVTLKSQPTMEALTAEYSRAKRVALGAQILGVGLLEKLALELMAFLKFLASFLYKSNIRVEVDASQVGRALQIRIDHVKKFYESIGEVGDEGGQQEHYSAWLFNFIGKAIEGDPEALNFFSLDEPQSLETGPVIKEVPNVTKLKMHFRRAKECAAVGEYLGDKQLLAVSKSVRTYTEYLAEHKHVMQLDVPIDGQDVAGSLLAHLQSLNVLRERILRRLKGQDSGSEDGSSESDDDGKTSKENIFDPDYEPEIVIRPKTKDRRSPEGRVALAQKKTTSEQQDQAPTIEKPVPVQENAIHTEGQRRVTSQQDKEKRRDDSTRETTDGEERREERRKKKKSHHSTKKCPLRSCNYDGPNLLRHLRSKHKMEKEEASKLNTIASLEGKRRGPKRTSKNGPRLGLKVKWCPVAGCNFATHLLRNHLQREHRLKNGEVLENHLRAAREYKGKLEQEEVHHFYAIQKRKRSALDDDSLLEPARKNLKEDETFPDDGDEEYDSEQEETEEDGNEENSESQLQVEYFTSKAPGSDRHRWLVAFYEYLNYPDCGRKKSTNRLQHASHIKTILEDLEPGGTGINILAEEEGYVVWTQWVDRNMGAKSSGTINSYLGTLEKFLTFVTVDRVRQGTLPTLAEDVTKILRNTKEKLKGWRRTVDLEMRPVRNKRLLDECDMRLTIEDVQKFHSSKPVVSARKTFQKAADDMPLTKDEICEARDLLIWLFTVKTGTRPGALENTQMQHYNTMRRDPVNGDPVMLIPEHKRAVDRPAMLAVDKELEDLLSVYVGKILPQFPAPRDDYLFLQRDGKRFTNGTINRRIPEMWLRSGVRSDLRVTATNVRKLIVTVLQEHKAAGEEFDERGVRIAMCHSQKTAMFSYLREDLTLIASRAARTIKKFVDRSSYQPKSAENRQSASEQQPLVTSDVDEQASDSREHPQSPFSENNAEKEPLPPTVSQRRPLSEEEKTQLQKVFQDTIKSNEVVTMHSVRETLKKDSKLVILVEMEGMVKKVVDYLRNNQKNEPREVPEELPVAGKSRQVEEWLNTQERPCFTSTCSSAKQKWSDEDVDEIVKVFTSRFGSLKKAPPRSVIKETFESEMPEILQRKQFLRCYNKVKHLVALDNKKRKK